MEIEVTDCNEITIWHKKNLSYYWHREDGPAFITNNGSKERWYYNNVSYHNRIQDMPLNLFLAYVKWEYKKSNGN